MLKRAKGWPRRPLDILLFGRPRYLPPFIWRHVIPITIIGHLWSLIILLYAIGLLLAVSDILKNFAALSRFFDGKFVLFYIMLLPTIAIPVLAIRAKILEILLWVSEHNYTICGFCGYDLRGSFSSVKECPECGKHYDWDETRKWLFGFEEQ